MQDDVIQRRIVAGADINWDQSPIYSNVNGEELIFTSSKGRIDVYDRMGQIARPSFLPHSFSQLFPFASNLTQLSFTVRTPSSSSLIVAAHGSMNSSGVTPSALFLLHVPSRSASLMNDEWSVSAVIEYGTLTSPQTIFSSFTVINRSKRVWLTVCNEVNSGPEFTCEAVHWNDDVSTPIRWPVDNPNSIMNRFIENGDGSLVIADQITSNSIEIIDVTSGIVLRTWLIDQNKLPLLPYSRLMLDGNNLYLLNGGIIAVAQLDITQTDIPIMWAFNVFTYSIDTSSFGAFLTNQMAIQAFLIPSSSSHSASSAQLLIFAQPLEPFVLLQPNFLYSFTSVASSPCTALPDANDNCGTCDDKTGVLTARNCAMCSNSNVCTEYYFPNYPAINQTCSDQGFPLSLSECNGAPSSQMAAIIVGVSVGIVIMLSLLICYCARRKPNHIVLPQSQYQAI